MTISFRKAEKHESKLRMALIGSSGSGKTYSALSVGTNLGGKVAVIDTERGSASKYADLFPFDVLELQAFSPTNYVEAIHAAEAAGYGVLIIDSLSHAWIGKGGALEMVDNAGKRSSGNNFAAWREVTPLHNALVDAMVSASLHVIVTMRSKTEYVIEENASGKKVPRKIGMAPVQRDGMEYEFDVVGDLDQDNNFIVTKTRCPELAGKVINKAGAQVANTLKSWLSGKPVEMLPEEKGKKLALSRAVQKAGDGYQVTDGQSTYQVTKANGVMVCDCPDYKEHSTLDPKYRCAHKVAVVETVTLDKELNAKAAAEQAR